MTKTAPTVVVLCGGNSDERTVSLRSGAAVISALQSAGYTVRQLDPSVIDGKFETDILSADVVFPVLHGRGGEDGTIQAWLQARHLRFVGSDATVSAICFDKTRYKQKLMAADLPVAVGAVVSFSEFQQSELVRQPYVLKPFDGGSSVDTFIIRSPESANLTAIEAAFHRHPRMLLEQLINGTEITVGVLGDKALPVIEIIPPLDGEFDYENKYNGQTQELCPARSVSSEVQVQAQQLALSIHRLCGCRDMSRTDMIASSDGSLTVLETNTIPGLTDQSLYPKSAAVAGYDMPTLVDLLVKMAMSRPKPANY